jgi:hypothetical protein
VITGATGAFEANELIDGGTSGALGRVVDWDGTGGVLRYVLLTNTANERPDFSGAETVTGQTSTESGVVGSVAGGESDEATGKILYFENRRAIARDAAQTEDYRLVVEF